MLKKNKKEIIRAKFFKMLILSSFVLLFYKSISYQLLPFGEIYEEQGEREFIRIKRIKAKRGDIYDRNLVPLAVSIYEDGEWKRKYPFGWITSNLIGFVNVDGEGLEGIEYEFNKDLKGKDGKMYYFRTADGKYLPLPEGKIILPKDGSDLILTIDIRIQKICAEVLKKYAERYKAKRGWVIAVDPRNGEILASCSYPFFNPERYYEYDNIHFRHNPVQYSFEPGSVFKPLTALYALKNLKVKLNEMFDVSKPIVIGNITINDPEIRYKKKKFFNLEEIIVHSSNIGISQVAKRLSPKEIEKFAKLCGFGTRTGILFPGENAGRIKSYKKWTKVDLFAFSFGQGLRVTPLQIAFFYSAIANGGYLLQPILIKGVKREEKYKEFPNKIIIRKIFDEKVSFVLKNILEKVVEYGSGKKAKIKGIKICGKTGTAQKYVKGKYSDELSIMSFVGFFPKENPVILIYIGLDEPKGVRFSSEIIPEMFKLIAKKIILIYGFNRYEA